MKSFKLLTTIFQPVVFAMNRLKFSLKFALIGLFLIIPAIVISLLLSKQIMEQIRLGSEVGRGLSYVKSIQLAVNETISSREALLSSDASKADEAKKRLAAAIDELSVSERKYSSGAATGEKLEKVLEQHAKLKEAALKDKKEIVDLYAVLMTELNNLITAVGDASNVNFDSYEGTSYLFNAYASQMLPQTNNTSVMKSIGPDVLARGSLTEDEKLWLRTASVKSRMNALQTSMDTFFRANPEYAERLQKPTEQAISASNAFSDLVGTKMLNAAEMMSQKSEFDIVVSKTEEANAALLSALSATLDEITKERMDSNRSTIVWVMLLVVFVIVLSVYLFSGFYISVIRSIRQLSEASATLAAGDLRTQIRLQTKDEMSYIAQSFNEMAASLEKLITMNKKVVDQVAESSTILLETSNQSAASTEHFNQVIGDIAQGSYTQSEAAQQSSTAMVEMAAGIQRIAESSSTVSEAAIVASTRAENGNTLVQSAIGQIDSIHQTVQLAAQIVHTLGQRSSEIGQIVGMISEIANQTNLLALNASIEAARAGEHGSGFAVVAAEVKKLANASKDQAQSIDGLIKDIQDSVNQAVQAMNQGVEDVNIGSNMMKETEASFRHILESVQEVAEQIQEISAAAEEMSAGSQEVSASLEEMVDIAGVARDKASDANSSVSVQLKSAETIQSYSRKLNELAMSLQTDMGRFKV
ncbi:methyl-accepting chemotaxis protein [Paenibacillus allorhizosphaerae]|uniref:IS66 family transposase ISPsy43 n=1 Tax=Paenibacillus allorhizosphaerae TaxID=2849866 RepID=A0ABN7TLT5_9BACL|nr:HAMP domain-containing methyl-accepting chemotaxis protein [Paenibacillus allorhizosphaerae]CAG7646177.1 IS66 family transposase ISPsy43 [Paenibacillus allorhizosphaerae]